VKAIETAVHRQFVLDYLATLASLPSNWLDRPQPVASPPAGAAKPKT